MLASSPDRRSTSTAARGCAVVFAAGVLREGSDLKPSALRWVLKRSELVVETRANNLGGQINRGREVICAMGGIRVVDSRVCRHLSKIQIEKFSADGPIAIQGPLRSGPDGPSNKHTGVIGCALGQGDR